MTASERPKLGAVLLAAGASSRLGRPKQLLKFRGETLIHRVARSLAESVYFPVVVVLGAEAEAVTAEITGLPVYTVTNESWAEGMSSSLTKGLEELIEIEPDVEGVLLTLCDQPFISSEMFERFAMKFAETKVPVIAAAYNNIAGVPALISNTLFDELLRLDGDKGARQVIRDSPDVLTIDLPEAEVDIDTEADLDLFGIENRE